jgi:hypothetical protein
MGNVSGYLSKQTLDWMLGGAAATQPAFSCLSRRNLLLPNLPDRPAKYKA